MTTPDLSPARARYLAECARGDPGVVIKRNPGIKGYEVKPPLPRPKAPEPKVQAPTVVPPQPRPVVVACGWEGAAIAFLRAALSYGTSVEELQELAREMERVRG